MIAAFKFKITRISGPYGPFNPSPCGELFGFCKTLICLPLLHQGHQGLPFGCQGISFRHQGPSYLPSVTKVFPLVTKVFPSVTKGFYYPLKPNKMCDLHTYRKALRMITHRLTKTNYSITSDCRAAHYIRVKLTPVQ